MAGFIIFAILFNVCHANNSFTENKPSHWCNSPIGYVEQSPVRGFIFMENQTEIWKDVVGYEGLYSISNLGRIKSYDRIVPTKIDNVTERLHKGRILTPSISEQGYNYIRLCRNGKGRNFQFHQLLAQNFIPNPDNKPHIHHINHIRNDNRIDNLMWCDIAENNAFSRLYRTQVSKNEQPILRTKILSIIEKNKTSVKPIEKKETIDFIVGLDRSIESYEDELWLDVKDFEGLYQVSNYGRIRGIKRYARTRWFGGDIVKQHAVHSGHLRGHLCKNGKAKCLFVHRLVAMAFISNPLDKPIINHIDGNPKNNMVTNLEWVTQKENVAHSYKLGLSKTGSKKLNACASESDVRSILEIHRETGKNGKYISDNFMPHLTLSVIGKIIRGQTYKNG